MLAIALASFCSQSADVSQTPASTSWAEVDQDVAQLAALQSTSNPEFEIGAYLKVAWLSSKTVNIYDPEDLNGASLHSARFWFESEIADWTMHLGLRGDNYPSQGFFGLAGTGGTVTTVDVYVSHALLGEALSVTVGNFRPPLVASSQYEENRLLFVERTAIGEIWNRYDVGARVDGELGPFRYSAAAQNGADAAGEDTALTVHGLWDVLGKPACSENEGALGAPDGAALSIGGGAYLDTLDDDYSTQSLEGAFTFERFAVQAELVDNGENLGDLYSWGVTASVLVLDDLEVAGRYESFDRDDGPKLYRIGVNKYFDGHDVKAQAAYTTTDSHAPLADVDIFTIGFVVSI